MLLGKCEIALKFKYKMMIINCLLIFNSQHSTKELNVKNRKLSQLKEKRKLPHMRSFTDQFDNHLSDSGFKSNCQQDKMKANEKPNNQKREIPYVLSFVGGFFTLKLYKNLTDSQSYESDNLPLLSMQMKQPNMMTVQDSMEKIEQFSLFNLSIGLVDQDKKSTEFNDTVFDTHRGELDDTGITPSLFEWKRIKCRNTNSTKIQCNMRKPIQLQFTPNNVEKLIQLKEMLEKIVYGDATTNAPTTNARPIVQYNKIKEIRKLIGEANSIEFNVTKVSVNFMTSMDRLVSIALFKWNNKITVQMHPEQICFAMDVNSLVVNTQNFMLLNPMSFGIDFVLSQEKWNNRLMILTNFTSNRIHLQINPSDFWTFAKVQLDFWSCFTRHIKSNGNEIEENEQASGQISQRNNFDNLIAYELPKQSLDNQHNEEYFQDDLR